jgi:hypothetical protein
LKENPPETPIALYDFKNDIGELKDLAAEHPEVVKRMEEEMKGSHVESDAFPLFCAAK